MTSYDAHGASADDLDRLISLAPDSDRAERVRVRCHAQLARSRRRTARTAETTRFASRVLVPAVVGAFCAFYVALLAATTLEIERIFR